MRFLIPLFLAWTASAQLPVVPFTSSLLSSGTIGTPPNQISNVRYWWNFTDNPTNVNVTNWIDRIQSLVLTNGADSKRPTNSTTGVGFNGSTYLTNTANFNILTGAGNAQTGSIWIVMSLVTSVGGLGGIVCDRTSGGGGLFETSGNQIKWFGVNGSGTVCDFASGSSIRDFSLLITNSIGSGQMIFYTNNVFIANAISPGDTTNPQKWVGCSETAGTPQNFAKMKILDLAYFYGKLSTTDIAALHTWATNQYSFSP